MNDDERLFSNNRLAGYLAFNGGYLVAAILTFGPPVSWILFPKCILAWCLPLAYYTYTFTLGRYELCDGCPWPEFCRRFVVFRAMRDVVQMEILPLPDAFRKAESTAGAQFVIAQFPHGAWADYHLPMVSMWHQAAVFPNLHGNIRALAASFLFRAPLVREWALWTHGLDARLSVAQAAMERGRTILVRPGGLAEQLRTTRGRDVVYLSNRRGFLRLAMANSVPVVPSFVFGASDAHYTPCNRVLFGAREWVQKRLGVCLPIAVGYCGSMCPLPSVKTTVVFGNPIHFQVQQQGNPTEIEVSTAHAIFCKALIDLYDMHKKAAGYGDRGLEIIL